MVIDKKYFDNSDLVFEKAIKRRMKRKSRRLWLLGLAATVFLCVVGVGKLWWSHVESRAHIYPAYELEEIVSVLTQKERLNAEDYKLLFQQTGMGRSGVDYLFANGLENQLLDLQEIYFAEVAVDCQSNTLITREERIEKIMFGIESNVRAGVQDEDKKHMRFRAHIPYVEPGDILISFNCHALGWRNGHVGLVVDAGKRLTLEASELGTTSRLVSMNHWERYPSFVVLRLKGVPVETRTAIAGYAAEYLTDITYQLEAGILDRLKAQLKNKWIPEKDNTELITERMISEKNSPGNRIDPIPALDGTHCAHLVWYAYNQFGYNVDSDGGLITTPRDLFNSDLWEIVQVYGMNVP